MRYFVLISTFQKLSSAGVYFSTRVKQPELATPENFARKEIFGTAFKSLLSVQLINCPYLVTDLQERFPQQISNARGEGTICAVNASSTEHRGKLINSLLQKGKCTWCDACTYSHLVFVLFPLVCYVNMSMDITDSEILSCVCLLATTGVQTSACGVSALRLRPALIAQRHHADIFLNILEDVLLEHQP